MTDTTDTIECDAQPDAASTALPDDDQPRSETDTSDLDGPITTDGDGDQSPSETAAAVAKVPDYTSNRILMLALAVLAMLAFANSLSGAFVFDDHQQIVANPLMGHWDRDTLARVFTENHWSALSPEPSDDSLDSIYYRPVFNLFLMLGYQVAGRDALIWHFVVVILHLLAAMLVFRVLEKSLAALSDVKSKNRRLMSAFAAGIYLVHPVQSESVSWISGLVNPLSALFMLAAFYCYLIYRRPEREPTNSLRLRAGATGLFALALLTKESALALLLIVAAYELFIFSRGLAFGARLRRAAIESLPFVCAAFGYMVLRYSVLGVVFGRNTNGNFPDDASLTLADNLLTLPALLARYLKLAVFPVSLSLIHDFGYVRSLGFTSFWMPLLVILAVGSLLVYLSRRVPDVKLAAIWIVMPLSIHLNTRAFTSEEIVHDRYLYLSMIGFGLLFAALIERAATSNRLRIPASKLAGASAVLLVLLAVLTAAQNKRWKSNENLWTHTSAHAPNSRIARLWLGSLAESRRDPQGAVREYEAALRINPDIIDALNQSALIYARHGYPAEATRRFERIVSLTPQSAIAHFNLSFVYAVQGRFEDAAREQRTAIELDPNGERSDEWRVRLDQLEQMIAASATRQK
ncbi:MAG: tetratricopeptide repeat protein [Blastocatellia bacterium]|nr:tetratricopeptide repeat protein [Blastocatellia bacterium]